MYSSNLLNNLKKRNLNRIGTQVELHESLYPNFCWNKTMNLQSDHVGSTQSRADCKIFAKHTLLPNFAPKHIKPMILLGVTSRVWDDVQ